MHVVQFSGGIGSWATARLVADEHGTDGLVLLFADTLIEDAGTYEFLDAAAADIGVPVTRISEGETPWDVFKRKRFLGNSRIDPCSQYLKRVPLRKWIEANCDPAAATIYLGIDWTESHRFDRAAPRWEPWKIAAPLIEARWSKIYMHNLAEAHGLPRQRLYEMGLSHANCGGGCVKAGQGHWAQLHKKFPERYAEWEANEADVADHLGRPVAMMTEERAGVRYPLPLSVLRERIENRPEQLDLFDIGGCGCAID
jgi:3'-phosphoadenosine 5'-phosphosulfate sulfotransferase (PAPS reductase)/FAD synthetase